MDFRDLPNELNEHIASFLPDSDLCNFTLVCRQTCNAVRGDHSGIWRQRFTEHFDLIPGLSKAKIRSLYQNRRKWLRKGATFVMGDTRAEMHCLVILRDLIVEAYGGKNEVDNSGEHISRNISTIKHFAENHGIFHEALLPRTDNQNVNSLLHTIRCVLSHLSLDFRIYGGTYGFPDSQIMAYRSADTHPIFRGPGKQDVDMFYVLHLINFFKYHLTRKHEYTLFKDYSEMSDFERPQAWTQQIKAGAKKLGRHWKGTYSYISEEADFFDMRACPSAEDQETVVADDFNGFQDLELEFPDPESFKWPTIFEEHLHVFPLATPTQSSAKPRAQTSTEAGQVQQEAPAARWDGIPFQGSGMDTQTFHATGWLHPLPHQPYTKPSHPTSSRHPTTASRALRHHAGTTRSSSAIAALGIPGFQRLTMMKYYITHHGTYDRGALWAYEGVVLPGGMLIVGRWWNSSLERELEDSYSGPFIMWNVDRSFEGAGNGEGEEGGKNEGESEG